MPKLDPFAAAFEAAALRVRPATERQRARDLSYIVGTYGAAHRAFAKVPEPPARLIVNVRTLGAREISPPLPPPPERDSRANAGLSGSDGSAAPDLRYLFPAERHALLQRTLDLRLRRDAIARWREARIEEERNAAL